MNTRIKPGYNDNISYYKVESISKFPKFLINVYWSKKLHQHIYEKKEEII